MIGSAREERKKHLVRRDPDAQRESEIAIVRNEDVLAAFEGHRGAGLHGFVPLAGRRERNLALAIELKAAVLQRTLHQHRAEDPDQLSIGQPLPVKVERRGLALGHQG